MENLDSIRTEAENIADETSGETANLAQLIVELSNVLQENVREGENLQSQVSSFLKMPTDAIKGATGLSQGVVGRACVRHLRGPEGRG